MPPGSRGVTRLQVLGIAATALAVVCAAGVLLVAVFMERGSYVTDARDGAGGSIVVHERRRLLGGSTHMIERLDAVDEVLWTARVDGPVIGSSLEIIGDAVVVIAAGEPAGPPRLVGFALADGTRRFAIVAPPSAQQRVACADGVIFHEGDTMRRISVLDGSDEWSVRVSARDGGPHQPLCRAAEIALFDQVLDARTGVSRQGAGLPERACQSESVVVFVQDGQIRARRRGTDAVVTLPLTSPLYACGETPLGPLIQLGDSDTRRLALLGPDLEVVWDVASPATGLPCIHTVRGAIAVMTSMGSRYHVTLFEPTTGRVIGQALEECRVF